MACKKCGSDWVTQTGRDCSSCPHCDKQQLFKARQQGRWVEPVAVKQCACCGRDFEAVGTKQIKQRVLCGDPKCTKSHRKAGKKRRASGVLLVQQVHGATQPIRHCTRCGKGPLTRNQRIYCSRECAGADARELKRGFRGISVEIRKAIAFANFFYEWDSERPKPMRQCCRKPRPKCQHCGNECKRRALRFCCYECVKAWRGIRKCDVCGVDVVDANSYSKCRCRSCKVAARKAATKKQRRKYGRNHRQRARYHGRRYVAVEVQAIYERDGWKCQICGRKCRRSFAVNKLDGRPHPRSPTIDHIRSLAHGGHHEPGNLQLACFECNTRKGAASRGQLRLSLA